MVGVAKSWLGYVVVMWKLVSKQNRDIQIYIQIANLEQDWL